MNREFHGRVKQVFFQAVELDPGQRASFLDHATANEPQLRREVEALLKHHSERTILPRTVVMGQPGEGENAVDVSGAHRIGRRLVAPGQLFRQLFGGRRRRFVAFR